MAVMECTIRLRRVYDYVPGDADIEDLVHDVAEIILFGATDNVNRQTRRQLIIDLVEAVKHMECHVVT